MDTPQQAQPSPDPNPNPNPNPNPDEANPLQFWVAYIPGEGEKKNYLSDGKGNLRLFKSEDALRKWLKPQLRKEVYEMVVVHPLQGQIAIPDDGTLGAPPPQKQRLPKIMPIVPLNMQTFGKPITTLAQDTLPSAQEQLDSLVKRKRRRRH